MGCIGCGFQVEDGWGIGGIQVYVQGDKGLIGVLRRVTVSFVEENKLRVLGAKKRRKTLSGHDLCEELLKDEICGDILLGYEGVILDQCSSVDEGGEVLHRDFI